MLSQNTKIWCNWLVFMDMTWSLCTTSRANSISETALRRKHIREHKIYNFCRLFGNRILGSILQTRFVNSAVTEYWEASRSSLPDFITFRNTIIFLLGQRMSKCSLRLNRMEKNKSYLNDIQQENQEY